MPNTQAMSQSIPDLRVHEIQDLKAILASDVELLDQYSIGGGSFADVYKARFKQSGQTLAIKVFREAHIKSKTQEQKEKYIKRLHKEYKIWSNLPPHRNILKLEGLIVDHRALGLPSPGLVSHYKPCGTLLDFLSKAQPFNGLHMVQEIAQGLTFIHSKNVVHGDLTIWNILVDVEKEGGAPFPIISDLGRARILEQEGYTTVIGGSPSRYQPPEVISASGDKVKTNKRLLTQASDVYTFALIMLQVLTGKIPFSQGIEQLEYKIAAVIVEEEYRPKQDLYPFLNPDHEFCWSIMEACWKQDPSERISSTVAEKKLFGSSERYPTSH